MNKGRDNRGHSPDLDRVLTNLIEVWIERKGDLLQLGGVSAARVLSCVADDYLIARLGLTEAEGAWCVVATGSYGRREISPASDIDVMILYSKPIPRRLLARAAAAVRELWDLGVTARIGAFPLAKAVSTARRDYRMLCALLDARVLGGQARLLDLWWQGLTSRGLWSLLRRLVEALYHAGHRQLRKLSQAPYSTEPDLKLGSGGLRDLAAIGWLGRLCEAILEAPHGRLPLYRRRLLESAVDMVKEDMGKEIEHARGTLLQARLFVSVWDSNGDERLSRRILARMRESGWGLHGVLRLQREVGRARAAVACALRTMLECVVISRPTLRTIAPRRMFVSDGAFLPPWPSCRYGGPTGFPVQLVRCHESGLRPSALALAAARQQASIRWSREEQRSLVHLLGQVLRSPIAASVLPDLHASGFLGRILPGFGRMEGVVPAEEVHAWTVDRHCILVALHAIESLGSLAVARETVTRWRAPLLLACLLHDVHKARADDDRRAAARIVGRAATTLGMDGQERELSVFLVENHHLLPHFSVTRDIEDESGLRDLLAVVRDQTKLELLWVLGTADIRAIGEGHWSSLRENLLGRLVQKLRSKLRAGDDMRQVDVASKRSWLSARASRAGIPSDVVEAFPDSLLASQEDRALESCLEALHAARERGPVGLVEPMGGVSYRVVFAGPDEPGLLSRLAGSLTLMGVSIAEARIFSVPPCLVLDIFVVIDPSGRRFVSEDCRRRAAQELVAHTYDPTVPTRVAARLGVHAMGRGPYLCEVENPQGSATTVVRVTGPDMPGLLYRVSYILFRHGLDVRGAVVTTASTMAQDTFFVCWAASGDKVTDPGVIRKIVTEVQGLGRADTR